MGYVGRKPTDAALTSSDIAPGAVDTANLAADAVTTAKIAPATVAAADIAPGTITTTQIAPATVAASNIAPGTITTTQISPAVPLGVPAVTSDPPSPTEGDMWLRKDLAAPGNLKAYLNTATGSWSTGGSQPAGNLPGGSGGPITAHWVAQGDGDTPYPPARSQAHFHYDGTSWSDETNFPYTGSSAMGTGTQSAHIAGAGHNDGSQPTNVGTPTPYYLGNAIYEWNGSSWASDSTLPTGFSSVSGNHGDGGTASAATIVGGWMANPYPPTWTSTTNIEWDNSSWSSNTAYPASVSGVATTGPVNALFAAKGTASNLWNGSSWASEGTLPTSMSNGGMWGGSESQAFITDEQPSNVTLKYNGTTWSSEANVPVSTGGRSGSGGSSSSGLLVGGYSAGPPNPYVTASYEFNGPGLAIQDLN